MIALALLDGTATRTRSRSNRVARPQLPALTGLRFFAALHVVLFHFSQPLLTSAPEWARSIVGTGYVGVSLFFVLSGFILAYNYADSDGRLGVSLREFWSARFARIYPVYLVGFILAGPFVLRAVQLDTLGAAQAVGVGTAAASLTQAWLPEAACVWNCPGWSLSAEAFFYLIFPFLLAAVGHLDHRRLRNAGLAIFGSSLLAPTLFLAFAEGGSGQTFWGAVVDFNPALRLPEFALGVVLGVWFLRGSLVRGTANALGIAALALLGGILLGREHIPYALLHNGLLAPIFGALILALGSGALASWFGHRWINRLGEASYALYILHVPLWNWAKNAFEYAGIDPEAALAFWLYLVLLIAISLATLRFVEEPARRWLRQRLAGRSQGPPRVPILAAIADQERA